MDATGSIDASLLRDDLIVAIGVPGDPQRWTLHCAQGTARVVFDASVPAAAVQLALEAHLARTPAQQAAAVQDYRARQAVVGIDRLQFEHLFELENTTRALKAAQNVLLPGTFPIGEAVQVTRAQYQSALINRWKQLNP